MILKGMPCSGQFGTIIAYFMPNNVTACVIICKNLVADCEYANLASIEGRINDKSSRCTIKADATGFQSSKKVKKKRSHRHA